MHVDDLKWPWTHKTIKSVEAMPLGQKETYTDGSWQVFSYISKKCIARGRTLTKDEEERENHWSLRTCERCGDFAISGLCQSCRSITADEPF